MEEGHPEELQASWQRETHAKSRGARSGKEAAATFLLLLLIFAAFIFFAASPHVFVPLKRAKLAEAINNAKQVKLALDIFAMDNHGDYPNAETARLYNLPSPTTSNDYFRQLIAARATQSERIFWIMDHPICTETAPDDVTSHSGRFSPETTLNAGENGLAYVLDQTNDATPDRPIIFDSPPTASGLTFDPDLWDGKVIVIRVDGSARAERLDRNNRLLDDDLKELLTPASKVWGSHTVKVEIAYPEPTTPPRKGKER